MGLQQIATNYCDDKPLSEGVKNETIFGGTLGVIGHGAGEIYGSNVITKLDAFNAKAAPIIFPAATDYTRREINEKKKTPY